VVAEVNRQYFHFDLTGFYEPMQLGVYTGDTGGHYGWHTDSSSQDSGVPRKLSMVLLLSEPSEFEGGEFQVKTTSDEAQTLELKRGRAWFFPSYTLHRVTPVTKGVRRSLVLWVGGPPFK
jgi:PKHD-type hydroxylase